MEDSSKKIILNFKLLTGGTFAVSVDNDINVDLLKKIVSRKLKINKDKICLMSSERELHDGTLEANGVINGSRIIVTPNVETGLAQRTENTVMQALESLNDNQVNDFLSGKSPLNLSVRLGDHMMLIQLQLSTLSPSQQNFVKQKVANAALMKNQTANRLNQKRLAESSVDEVREQQVEDHDEAHQDDSLKSPIKSLSSMVSNPLTTTVENMNNNINKFWLPSADPIAANLTSCLCKRLNISCNNNCGQRAESVDDAPCCSYSNVVQPNPIPFHQRPSTSIIIKPQESAMSPSTSKGQSVDSARLENLNNPALAEASRNLTQTLRKLSKRVFTGKNQTIASTTASTSTPNRKTTMNNAQPTSSGAIIESMKHHGKGIYSGTFSGTLNPALQDNNGRPKRDISTIIHILNDLLSATPQCARSGTKIFFEPSTSSSGSTGKFIRVRKTTSPKSSCIRCTPTTSQLNFYQQSEEAKAGSSSRLLPSSSTAQTSCFRCSQTGTNSKLEIENMKTKLKIDQLKLVMQQKKENRAARKLNSAPYNLPRENAPTLKGNHSMSTTVSFPSTSTSNSLDESSIKSGKPNLNNLNGPSSSSSTAITTISTNNSEIENHLEEVNIVA